jgi:hypothetical protein
MQFELAERESTLNAQTRALNESRERLEAERIALEEERKQLTELSESLKKDAETLEVEKAALNAEKQAHSSSSEDSATIQRRYAELQEYERNLMQREAELNNRARDMQARSYMAYPNENYGYAPYGQPVPQNTRTLTETANQDGITVYTTGKMERATVESTNPKKAKTTATYNVGATLFKTTIIIFCIVAFESLSVFFGLEELGITPLYPLIGFSLGFIAFLVSTILYLQKYKPNAKLKKSAPYITTCVIIFVIAAIAVTMIAVYMNAKLSIPSKLFAYVIVPIVYLLNIIFFAVFYRMLSKQSTND